MSNLWKSLWRKMRTRLNFNNAYHPQIDGQIEMVNHNLDNLLRNLVRDKPIQWDTTLTWVEFAYNRSQNQTTQLSPFKIVYGQNPTRVLELIFIPRIGRLSIQTTGMIDYLHGICEQVKHIINDNNTKYKALIDTHHKRVMFEVDDLVCVILIRDRFIVGKYNKQKEMKIGLYEVLQKINNNTYMIRLPRHTKTSDGLNIQHSTSYLEEEQNSKTSTL